MKGRYWVGACLMACAFAAFAAGGTTAVRAQVEASLLLTGSITVASDGRVSAHTLDKPDKLEPGIIAMINETVPNWRFEPVLQNGKAIAATAKMSFRVVANKVDADHYAMRIRNASFWMPDVAPTRSTGKTIRKEMTPPRYPAVAYRSGVAGTVYLVARLDTDGHVLDVVAEQVNLSLVASEREMDYFRDVLAAPALRAVRSWRLNPATDEEMASGKIRTVRVPVAYRLDREPGYGRWEPYVPGPKQRIPWLTDEANERSSPDALVAGGVYQFGEGLRLLTPLGDG